MGGVSVAFSHKGRREAGQRGAFITLPEIRVGIVPQRGRVRLAR